MKLLKNNLFKLSKIDNVELINSSIEKYLDRNLSNKYEIFFLDPPFSDKMFLKNLEKIKKNKLYFNNHIVVLHRERRSDDNFSDVLKVFEVKFYGKSKIIFGYFI